VKREGAQDSPLSRARGVQPLSQLLYSRVGQLGFVEAAAPQVWQQQKVDYDQFV
jgi:hypothetical protein